MLMLNHERIELETLLDRHDPDEFVAVLAEILIDKSNTDRNNLNKDKCRAIALRLRTRALSPPVVTEGNLVDVLEQCKRVARGELHESLDTAKFNRNLARLKGR